MKSLYMRNRTLYNQLQRQCAEYNKKALQWCFNRPSMGYAMIHPTEDKVVIFDTNNNTITLKEL